jgi:DNA-directed RNA polymerase specialized sigma24 family protein
MGVPDADVEDVTQEVFLVVRRKLASFDCGNLSAWLDGIALRTARDHPGAAPSSRRWIERRADGEAAAGVAREAGHTAALLRQRSSGSRGRRHASSRQRMSTRRPSDLQVVPPCFSRTTDALSLLKVLQIGK